MSFWSYFVDVFRRKGPHTTTNINTRMMHGINRISIVMFGFAVLVLLFRLVRSLF